MSVILQEQTPNANHEGMIANAGDFAVILGQGEGSKKGSGMPRMARYAPGGLVYHVLNRGVGRQQLFFSDDDYLAFEQHEQLRSEIQGRLEKVGQGHSEPLDRMAFKAEARRRLAEEG